ncbi:hypothetical protein O0I10_011180 [Lichtheimia ornata]|uniref:Uncharacterized protein n=1 Tax=Lichtheimia ornata TaxID=688661 RepID=A0AAD7UU53_9FUNG|nr:uncharacterized protein O0I10_011180 [Lichtheimia ornata]KAJ8653131.1 hypothetical protein O0I10_011180 [Lichtheimia ornata]
MSIGGYKGQTALMYSVLFTNNFDRKSFYHLLDMLQKTIFSVEKEDLSVFHHMVSTSSWKGKVHDSYYYMECLIDKLSQIQLELISILNVHDVYGDTALTMAARTGNKRLLKITCDEVERRMLLQDNLAAATTSPNLTVNSVNEQAAMAHLRQKFKSVFKMILSNDRSVTGNLQLFDGFVGSYERRSRIKGTSSQREEGGLGIDTQASGENTTYPWSDTIRSQRNSRDWCMNTKKRNYQHQTKEATWKRLFKNWNQN